MANVTDEISKLKEITDKLEQGIAELFESEKYMEYLRTMSRFYNYSFNNTLLIAMQKPDATLIAGYKSWQNNFERHVLKGEKGIRIIAPAPYKKKEAMEKIDPDTQMPILDPLGKPVVEEVEITIPDFRVVPVFDVSQTEGKEISDIEVNELMGTVENYTIFMQALSEVSPAPIEYETIDGGAKGYYSPADRRIAIQKDMSEIQTIKTAIHEIAHAKLHDMERNKELGIETLPKDHRTKEVEAESVAYTVCQHYGIETSDYSFGYVAGWSSGKELNELKSSLELIRKTASELINSIDDQVKQIGQLQIDRMEIPELTSMQKTEKLIAIMEREKPCFSADEKNLLMNYAYQLCDIDKVTLLANELSEQRYGLEYGYINPKVVQQIELEIAYLPDGTVSMSSMLNFGYSYMGMLPLGKEKAIEFWEEGIPIYRLYYDETEGMVENLEEIMNHDGLFGVERTIWDTYLEVDSVQNQLEESIINQEALLLNGIEDYFEIYQLKDVEETSEFRFESMEYMRELRFKVEKDNYDLIYSAPLSEKMTLEEIFQTFNLKRPEDFQGHSLSMSDVIVLHKNGEATAHYIDRFGFEEVPQFLAKELEVEQIKNQVEAADSIYSISFYAAECMEFTNYGEYHDHLSLDEAVKIYEAIPSKRLNAGKGIGFILHNANETRPGFEDSSFDLYSSGKIDEDIINLIPEFKNNQLVQQAIKDIAKYFPNAKTQKKANDSNSVKEEVDTPEKLAVALDEFSYYNDPYGYMDTTPDREEQVRTLKVDIVAGKVERIKEYLEEIIAEGEPIDDVVSARALIKRLENLEVVAKERAVTKEPIVTVIWSESPFINKGAVYPLSEANKLFGQLDSQQKIDREKPDYEGLSYYKTKFQVEYLIEGKLHKYGGRQDLGDGDGTLIEHIRGNADYYLKNKEYRKYLKSSNQSEYEQAIKHYEYVIDDFVPYLRMHCNLSEIEQNIKDAMGMIMCQSEVPISFDGQMDYYKAMLDYVADSRENLNFNIGEFKPLEPPKMEDYLRNNPLEKVEELLEGNYNLIDGVVNNEKLKNVNVLENRKTSIRDRLAGNKERIGKKQDTPKQLKDTDKKNEMRIE